MLGAIMLGAESRLNIYSAPNEYFYAAKLAPASLLVFVVALALYLAALFCPDNFPARDEAAGLTRRFGAFVVDFMMCGILATAPMTLVALGLEGLATGQFSLEVERDYRMGHDSIASGLVIVSMVIMLLLFSLPLSNKRRSAGTVLCGFAIRSDEPLGLGGACGRTFLGFITLSGMIVSVPMALRRDDKRMWHDLAFDTRAVVAVAPHPAGETQA